ncbi:MAG TPA: hypothetical protein DGG95_17135 [Cytophagales bacterium]|jgi:hypothetical protein|nr:hypothetical protein [Cytophagales bacterium]
MITKEAILSELQSNPKVIAYTAPYNKMSVHSFLDNYANTKLLLLNYGEHYRTVKDNSLLHYQAEAERYYWQIAQKKLFNLQCQWRAQQIDLPIEVTYEFFYWGQNIKACPFIETTSEDEINTLIEFLEGAPYDHHDNDIFDWQDYEGFKDEEDAFSAGDAYPNWYAWYDVHVGPPHLLTLPDLRGAYQEKCFTAMRTAAEKNTVSMPGLQKPFLSTSQTEDFIKQVENYQINDYYRAYKEWSRKNEKMEPLEAELQLLLDEPGEVYIPAGRFPDAIFQATYLLRIKKIKELIFSIHHQHIEQLEMGITYHLQPDEFIATNREAFKKARKLLEGN